MNDTPTPRPTPEEQVATIYTHSIPANDLLVLIERLRTIDDMRYDCCLISWQQARALAAHIDQLNDTIRQLAGRVADQSEALSRRAEGERQ